MAATAACPPLGALAGAVGTWPLGPLPAALAALLGRQSILPPQETTVLALRAAYGGPKALAFATAELRACLVLTLASSLCKQSKKSACYHPCIYDKYIHESFFFQIWQASIALFRAVPRRFASKRCFQNWRRPQ